MPVFEEKSDGGLMTVSFQESPIMSTYLVAIIVGEFEYIERTTTTGNKVRVYCEAGKTNQGKFALDVAVQTLPYYAEKLGWEPIPGESHLNAMLRGQILELLAQFGHEETQEEAIRRFNAFLNDRSTPLLPADIRKAAYIAVMQNVTTSDKYGYESLLRIFRETDLSQEKVRILSSIASSPDSSIVREALDFSLSSEVRNQDAVFVLRGISREARETAWLWLKLMFFYSFLVFCLEQLEPA